MDGTEKSKACILVVDDEKNIQETLSRHFRFLGYDVDTVDNGSLALDALAKKRYEVVITDISMPVMDGIQLLRAIRKEYPMVHCIIMTGYVTMENILSCMRLGADTCIYKPFEDLKEMEEAVESAVAYIDRWQKKLKTLLRMKP
ncbi:MAG TPA: response regulator [Candidatus Omnitrophota bacterium]|nr:response regulator [Candidatus Omnitrophota bacterium]HPS20104.1 response regulator [Candidatus Omnitrophota bacterium]